MPRTGQGYVLKIEYQGWVLAPSTQQRSGNQDCITDSGQSGSHSFSQSLDQQYFISSYSVLVPIPGTGYTAIAVVQIEMMLAWIRRIAGDLIPKLFNMEIMLL